MKERGRESDEERRGKGRGREHQVNFLYFLQFVY